MTKLSVIIARMQVSIPFHASCPSILIGLTENIRERTIALPLLFLIKHMSVLECDCACVND